MNTTSFSRKQKKAIQRSPVSLAEKVIDILSRQIQNGTLDIHFDKRIARISPELFLAMNANNKQLLAFIKNINFYINCMINISNGYNQGCKHPYVEGVKSAVGEESKITDIRKLEFFISPDHETPPTLVGIYINDKIELKVP